MTVRELKGILNTLPDSYEVWAYSEEQAAEIHITSYVVHQDTISLEGY